MNRDWAMVLGWNLVMENQEMWGLERAVGCDLSLKLAHFGARIPLCFLSAVCVWFRGEWDLHPDMLREEQMFYIQIF